MLWLVQQQLSKGLQATSGAHRPASQCKTTLQSSLNKEPTAEIRKPRRSGGLGLHSGCTFGDSIFLRHPSEGFLRWMVAATAGLSAWGAAGIEGGGESSGGPLLPSLSSLQSRKASSATPRCLCSSLSHPASRQRQPCKAQVSCHILKTKYSCLWNCTICSFEVAC